MRGLWGFLWRVKVQLLVLALVGYVVTVAMQAMCRPGYTFCPMGNATPAEAAASATAAAQAANAALYAGFAQTAAQYAAVQVPSLTVAAAPPAPTFPTMPATPSGTGPLGGTADYQATGHGYQATQSSTAKASASKP